MPFITRIGELSEIASIGPDELSVEWRIPNVLSLYGGRTDYYRSPELRTGDEIWWLMLWLTSREYLPGCVRLSICRIDKGPGKTFHVSVGIKGSRGLENIRKVQWEFSDADYEYCWDDFCTRADLMENVTSLMPDGGGLLTIKCVLKRVVPGADGGELPSEALIIYSYKELQAATQNFCDLPLRFGGWKIGEGEFGTVYRAVIKGDVIAVKRLKDAVDKQFIAELKALTNYKHENLLPLIGCSLDPTCCLLYEFMPNFSLQDRLACVDQTEPLSWQTRLSISYGSALGINHLHTFGEEPMVHRDIKSSNILLDQNFAPKVSDFGLMRSSNIDESSTKVVKENENSTRVYMPKEALLGEVSVKWDTFSFGVVLLELLTGLPPFDPNREDRNLVTHIGNCEDILPRLDPKAEWNQEAATELYRITQRCLEEAMRSRPTISEILEDLRKLSLLR